MPEIKLNHTYFQHKMNKMKIVCLLILSLMTGFGASAEVKGCSGGWVEFTCKYPTKPKTVFFNKIPIEQSNLKNKWVKQDRFSLYNDTINKHLRLIVRDLKPEDSGSYCCGFNPPRQHGLSEKLEVVTNKGCQTPVYQGVYKRSKTTIRCDDHDKKLTTFFCKENKEFICEEISSSQMSNGTFSLKKSGTGFNVTISEVSSKDVGVYWCGVKEKNGRYRAGFKKIHLYEIITFTKMAAIGQELAFYCEYKVNEESLSKFICKGEDRATCLVLTKNTENNSRFSMKEDKTKRRITIKLSDVRDSDSGSYWCGAENTDERHSKIFTHKMSFSVVTTRQPVLSETGGSNVAQSVIIGVIGLILLLLLMIVLIFIYKKYFSTETKAEAQQSKEEYVNVYEEIPERLQTSTVYATANFPTDNSSSLHYSTIVLPNGSSDKSDGGVLVLRPSSASCQYSVLKCSSSSTSLTVQPSSSTDQPLYSTVQKSQQK